MITIPKIVYQFVRFAGIGFLNTAVDFTFLNLLAVSFGVYVGLGIGLINAFSFGIAVLHSYFWNKYWAFSERQEAFGLGKNLAQFTSAAFLGGIIVIAVIFGAGAGYSYLFFILLLLALIVGEILLWLIFRLQKDPLARKSSREMMLFIIISVIGLLINTGIIALVTTYISPQFGFNQELWTNLIKVMATCVALVWNFTGYKLIVFRR